MRSPTLSFVLAHLALAGVTMAQIITYTLPYVDGDTLVISTGTNALGVPTTQTLRTLTGGASAVTSVPGGVVGLSSSSSSSRAAVVITSSSSSISRSTARVTTATTAAATGTATTPRVGQDTALPPPMRTTTYDYDTGNGYWTKATWTASVTKAPDVATVIVPKGTVQEYPQYQTSVNSNVLASAQASVSRAAAEPRAASQMTGSAGLLGWGIMGVGAVLGAGLAL
ncbi:uncharacterized protein MKK02DRAFT_38083 [Dioszegia hungarica]|uniref:Uncharacterized protein n=1 Tax=Dioszegia hungarica TaxID=4972 RepID=A0AA38H5M9_9TREE|nr:uncharacterized protein MKK02DRAFT_38082 [Dioszegia hungarica]XP_052944332.1 uncharacterized protein MKK02DRAFT_38083 [Dioszegia hungarica]KAI9634554.1 hypothetical protein MKK02DRAFT_38082 [Dioszegia hungarica]KAI9634555.1 hypothetical protein MKK02DRAFT_38083 [Dioszegia hungarica]